MKRPTKKEIRQQLNDEVEQYLQKGGEVSEVVRGATGLQNGRYDERSMAFEKPKEERTPVPEVMQAIDQRRDSQRKPGRSVTATSQPRRRLRKKIIYDDFGEPLRIIWE
ncbi:MULTISPECIES: hypothetical protein [unclassified Oceanobacter]|uniref:hypothetical protein n=1 Tax=unclassified Oceanobacter TaxID=2620260 RepID=UPI0026E1C5E6|nr:MULTISPECIES: hypothetical protein [unclassified Oceanobacter]MDO6681387.1 hypothetical protein [Oceanobacter sp. 5_MG-2023]MDP2505096.1 hypothetical protein [Oceanobacter sp. 3_MG-2023]MDP2548220.1 hypothetical protein [Oceanobacter sp. 4_MG-2023]MDP2608142.1 hypothetical protein [Oceanobacter sp. 1_MG-2023]MDP2611196.1 hypothetical protein [Oceanobacter sp. 2_MG-2023]